MQIGLVKPTHSGRCQTPVIDACVAPMAGFVKGFIRPVCEKIAKPLSANDAGHFGAPIGEMLAKTVEVVN